jgi:hypothetical protein
VDGVARDLIVTGATTINWSWNTSTVANGSHTISVTVTDATGRRGIGTEYVTVQNTLVVAITNPAAGATLSGTAFVDVWVEGQSGTSNAFALTVNGQIVASQTISGRHATLAWDTTRTPDGPQTILATVVDATNNGGRNSRAVTVRNGVTPTPLAASFTVPAAGATVAGTVAVGLASSGGTGPYTYPAHGRRRTGLLDHHDRHDHVVRLEHHDRRQRRSHARPHRHRLGERLGLGLAPRDRAERLHAAAARGVVHRSGRRGHRLRHRQRRPRRQRGHRALHLSPRHRRHAGLLDDHRGDHRVVRLEHHAGGRR